jgi:hypothetical protein
MRNMDPAASQGRQLSRQQPSLKMLQPWRSLMRDVLDGTHQATTTPLTFGHVSPNVHSDCSRLAVRGMCAWHSRHLSVVTQCSVLCLGRNE